MIPIGGRRFQNRLPLFVCLVAGTANAQAIRARDFFQGNLDTVRISTKAGQTLIFDARDGDYVLNGHDLYVESDAIELIGEVVIRSYSSDYKTQLFNSRADAGHHGQVGRIGQPGEHGEQGSDGKVGAPGRNAPHIAMRVEHIVGTGKLLILNDGTNGSSGQDGGYGGIGGEGGAGDHRSGACPSGLLWLSPGGRGGDGGAGGEGGRGGKGGNGGEILYSKALQALVLAGRVTLQSNPGNDGQNGRPGPGGIGGLGGATGQGCGPYGPRAEPGYSDWFRSRSHLSVEESPKPTRGSIRCLDCQPPVER